ADAVGVGVLVRGAAVRRPARVADAGGSARRVLRDQALEDAQLAPAPQHAGLARRFDDGDARGLIASGFEAAQPFPQQWGHVSPPDISDDSAHDSTNYTGAL